MPARGRRSRGAAVVIAKGPRQRPLPDPGKVTVRVVSTATLSPAKRAEREAKIAATVEAWLRPYLANVCAERAARCAS